MRRTVKYLEDKKFRMGQKGSSLKQSSDKVTYKEEVLDAVNYATSRGSDVCISLSQQYITLVGSHF